MKRAGLFLMAALMPGAAFGQISPTPGLDNPRLQTITYRGPEPIRLVAMPNSNLTVMFHARERIKQVTISDRAAFQVSVSEDADSLDLMANQMGATATLNVVTSDYNYQFQLETGRGLTAAYLVRFVNSEPAEQRQLLPPPDEVRTGYKISGSKTLRPTSIEDDGQKVYITWGQYQSIPAVFGIGPSGDDEVVDGFMRDGVFTIDRIYPSLIFRIDKEVVRADRNTKGRKER